MRVMIDTNVVLDVLLKREPFFSHSYEVLRLSALQTHEGFISAAAVTDVFYIVRKSLKDVEKAKESMSTLLQLVGIADATGIDVHNAIEYPMNDFEDALVAAIAKRCELDCIITRNKADFMDSPIRAVTPQEFLTLG